ncbi:MAG: type II toxin-antitoxin system PemK/MazF family toxin [Deltaproteobacteria bacterium]|nr:type II toxin-antitoxin system PemK/MazF family toxin [Deltaproteobacteria bacterium]
MKLQDLPRGSVVLVAFPFTDLTATKVRPAIVLSTPEFHARHGDVIIAAVSSVVRRPEHPTSVLLPVDSPDFARTGLRVASTVHCGKLVTVQGTLVLKRLGHLASPALRRVDTALRRAVGLA